MSAPVTHDPLVVNTRDGVCWERRAVTSDGRGLYAVEGSCRCPEFVMATLAELAEHGIAGTADALPVPVGAEVRTLDKVEDELTGVNLALYEEELENARLRLALASAQRGRRELRARVAGLTRENERLQRVADSEHKAFLDTHSALNLVVQDAQRLATENGVSELVAERDKLRDDVERAGRRVENSRKANRELRARVAELEAERHSTNEALDDAVQALRDQQTPVVPKPGVTGPDACKGCGSAPETWCPDCAACEQGCFGGFDGNACTHANAEWGERP